jgi:hypothetical protein
LDEEKEDEEDQALESRGLEYEIKCCWEGRKER